MVSKPEAAGRADLDKDLGFALFAQRHAHLAASGDVKNRWDALSADNRDTWCRLSRLRNIIPSKTGEDATSAAPAARAAEPVSEQRSVSSVGNYSSKYTSPLRNKAKSARR